MMTPSADDDAPVFDHSLIARVATLLERACFLGVRVAVPGMVISGGALLLYIIVGTVASILDVWEPQFAFLTLSGDPTFPLLAFFAGLNVCLGTGAIIVLALMRGVESTRSKLSMLAAFVGFGFGAGVIRLTFPVIVQDITVG